MLPPSDLFVSFFRYVAFIHKSQSFSLGKHYLHMWFLCYWHMSFMPIRERPYRAWKTCADNVYLLSVTHFDQREGRQSKATNQMEQHTPSYCIVSKHSFYPNLKAPDAEQDPSSKLGLENGLHMMIHLIKSVYFYWIKSRWFISDSLPYVTFQ